jgi:uncharacterized membrane protein YcaP (DUF421 family)
MTESCGIIDKLRKPKIVNMSIFDWVTSLLGAWIIGRFIFNLTGAVVWITFILFWIALGVFIHWLVGVPTMFGYYLGISKKPQRKQC